MSTTSKESPRDPALSGGTSSAIWDEAKAESGGGIGALLAPIRTKIPKEQNKGDFSLLPRLLAMARPYELMLAFGLIAVFASAVLSLVALHFYEPMITAIEKGTMRDLNKVTLTMLGLYVAMTIVSLISGYLLSVVGLRVTMDLRLRLYEHLQTQQLGYFTEKRTGELVSRLMNDVAAVRNVVSSELAGVLRQIVTFAGALVMILLTDWRLALLMFALVPAVTLISVILGRLVRRISISVTDRLAAVATVLEESISGVRNVRSFVREDYEIKRFRGSLSALLALALKRVYLQVLFSPLLSMLFFSATVVLIWFGGRQVIEGKLDLGELIKFIALTSMMASSIGWFGGLWTRIQETLGACQRIFEILDTPPDLAEQPEARELGAVEGTIALDGVSFAYKASEESAEMPQVLRDISLEVRPGEVLALVGPSGSGKTTLVSLVPRFYDPTAGTITIDGTDIRSVTFASLRRQIGLVSQEAQLFGGTVRQNILYGRLDASKEEMIAAAQAANAHDFIEELPNGYDTVVGERATKLSGGQRQRIAIARALLKDPKILLLDEATSALDTESEQLVQEALDRLMSTRTSIVIAHRLSTVRGAHRIAVLEAGAVVELGTHEELMEKSGLYARLYRHQFREGDGA